MCLPACVAMLSAYLGQEISQERLAREMGTRDFGTPAPRIRRLKRMGFSVTYESGSVDLLRRQVRSDIPTIVFVWTGELPYWRVSTPHAVVVVAVTDETIYVNDPAFDAAPQEIPIDDFVLAWSEFDYRYATVMPTPMDAD